MNSKRQTIWLVSMLSLMVVLSAYYLFTEDVSTSSDMLTDGAQQEQTAKENATEASGSGGDAQNGITVTEVASSGGQTAADKSNASAKDDGALSEQDQEVLNKFEASASTSTFNKLQEQRDQKFYDEYNKLFAITSDAKQDAASASKAVEQLDQLEDKNTKITGLEEELVKQFSNAVVTEENDEFRVVVQSEKLDRSQADDIVMKVMKELGARADQVTVQYIP